MSFKQSILKKIEINKLAAKVRASLVPKGDVQKVDKTSMQQLLGLAGYERTHRRDLELYIGTGVEKPERILVLDNGLAIFQTTIEDVVLRKSPTIKEMISIRNVVKILKDDDVVVSKKTDSVKAVRKEAIETLDLSYTNEEIDAIRLDGAASLESGYADGIIESLDIFSELLGYQPPPRAFTLPHHQISGDRPGGTGNELRYGPMVLFSRVHQTLKMIDTPLNASDREQMTYFQKVADNQEKAPYEGVEVFRYLMSTTVGSDKGCRKNL